LEAARLHALGWLAADPQSTKARAQIDFITHRRENPPMMAAADGDDIYAELRATLEANAHDFEALMSIGHLEYNRGDYRVAKVVFERALAIAWRSDPASPLALDCRIWLGHSLTNCSEWKAAQHHIDFLAGIFETGIGGDAEMRVRFEVLRLLHLLETGQTMEAANRAPKALRIAKSSLPPRTPRNPVSAVLSGTIQR
jgi:tetratricopeptide (TPR) repeat protein